MIKTSNQLFGFNHPTLPGIFDKIERNRTTANTPDIRFSKYTSSPSRLTLMAPFVKALWIYLGQDKVEHSLGKLANGCYAAEIASRTAPGMTLMAIYNAETGDVTASCFDAASASNMQYNFNKEYQKKNMSAIDVHHSDGSLIWFVMMEKIFDDEEAVQAKDEMLNIIDAGLSGDDLASAMTVPLGLLCDNVYRRLTNSALSDDVRIILKDVGKTGPLKMIQTAKLQSPEYKVREIIIDGFTVFNSATAKLEVKPIEKNEFNLGISLTDIQKEHMKPLPRGHVTAEVERDLLETIKFGWDNPVYKVSNVLLVGPPGSGKTEIAVAVAHHLGLPYFTVICSDGMTEDDLRGAIYPSIGNGKSKIEQISEGGMIPVSSKAIDFPTELEIKFEPEQAYYKMTGKMKKGIRSYDVMSRAYHEALQENMRLKEMLNRAMRQTSQSGLEYVYVPSEVVLAFEHGGILEIQEPSSIMSQTVLTFMNDIMNSDDGVLYTPYGRIKRHKNCIVIGTNNPDSDEGYKSLNQAVKDRYQLVYWVDLPPISVMVDRVLEKGIVMNEYELMEMAKGIQVLSETARNKHIKGVAGMRCYQEWAKQVSAGKDFWKSLDVAVINKMTTNQKEREYLYSAIQDNTQLDSIMSWKKSA